MRLKKICPVGPNSVFKLANGKKTWFLFFDNCKGVYMAVAYELFPSLIAIDWGTTNRRGYLLNHEGVI